MGWFFGEFWLFSCENLPKSADCSANFDFFPVKMPRNRSIFPRICPWKSREILLFSAKYQKPCLYHDVPWLLKWILFFHFKLANFNQVPVHKSKIRSDSYWSGKSWTIRHFTLFHLAVPEFPDMSGQIPVCPRHHFDLWRERLELIISVSKQKWSPIKTQLNIPNTTNLRFQTSEMIADHQRNLGCFRKMEMSPAFE